MTTFQPVSDIADYHAHIYYHAIWMGAVRPLDLSVL